MTGLAYSADYQRSQDPVRVPVAFALAFFVHFLPFAYLIMPPPPEPEPEELQTATVDITDFTTALAEKPPAKEPQPDALAALKLPAPAPDAMTAPAIPVPLAPVPPAPPAGMEQPKPPEAAPPTPAPKAPEAAKPDAKTDIMALTPLKSENMAAFDNSKNTTDKPPEDSYASDSNSTAADRGPKNLPRGDIYNKNGETNFVRDLGRRGEGNLPAIDSSANSGSIKVEGSPDAGKGFDSPRPDRERPLELPIANDKSSAVARVALPGVPVTPKTEPIAAPVKDDRTAPASKPKPSGLKPEPLGSGPAGEQIVTGPVKTAVAPTLKPGATPPAPRKIDAPEGPAEAVVLNKTSKSDEIASFKALLDAPAASTGAGGETGDKPGIQARPGKKGHEGDGTLRPGDDDAVSDVVTFNVSSSAEEIGEPRFAKHLDLTAKYVRPIIRRADAKWKAIVTARMRSRMAVGVVTIYVVVSKSGKLLEARVEHRDDGMPTEYISMAKDGLEQAFNPAADPFSGELAAKNDKISFVINFGYNQ